MTTYQPYYYRDILNQIINESNIPIPNEKELDIARYRRMIRQRSNIWWIMKLSILSSRFVLQLSFKNLMQNNHLINLKYNGVIYSPDVIIGHEFNLSFPRGQGNKISSYLDNLEKTINVSLQDRLIFFDNPVVIDMTVNLPVKLPTLGKTITETINHIGMSRYLEIKEELDK